MRFNKPNQGRVWLSALSLLLFIGAAELFRDAASNKPGGLEPRGGDDYRFVWVESPAFQHHAFGGGVTLCLVALGIAYATWLPTRDDN